MDRLTHCALCLFAALAGCTLERGSAFATLSPSLEAGLSQPADRALADGWQRLNTDFEVKLTTARLELGAIALSELVAGGGGGAFDPAVPPAGYSLCHGGHCHRDDGALIPYEEIEAQLSGGGGARTLLTLPVPMSIDLLARINAPLECAPSCDLPRSQIKKAQAPVSRLVLEGEVRDSRATPRLTQQPWKVDLDLTGSGEVALLGRVDLPADRTHAPLIQLAVVIEPSAALLDSVAFDTLVPGPFDLAADATARKTLIENLKEISLELDVSRSKDQP